MADQPMTDLPEMTPSAERRAFDTLGYTCEFEDIAGDPENLSDVAGALKLAWNDGALAARERIVAWLREGDERIVETCIIAIGAHDSATESAIDIMRALADRIAAEER